MPPAERSHNEAADRMSPLENTEAATEFFSLPAELRNKIYEFVCFHEGSEGGIMFPSGWTPVEQLPSFEDNSFYSAAEFQAREHRLAEERPLRHKCTAACLLQPSISKVNRQMRMESLAVFYGSNEFRICMSAGKNAASGLGGTPLHSGKGGLSCAWWRAIGYTNLRTIAP